MHNFLFFSREAAKETHGQWGLAPLDGHGTNFVVTYLHNLGSAALGITTLSSREFNQDASRAKKAAQKGPVFITDRGRPAHVLLTIEAYRELAGGARSLLDAIAQTDGGDFDFDPPKMEGPFGGSADLR